MTAVQKSESEHGEAGCAIHLYPVRTTLNAEEAQIAKSLAKWIVDGRVVKFNLRAVMRSAGIPGISNRTDRKKMRRVANYLTFRKWIVPVPYAMKAKRGRPRLDYRVSDRVRDMIEIIG